MPALRWDFDDWIGNMAGSSRQITISVSGNATLTAAFIRPQVSVTLQNAAGGALEPVAGAYTFDAGDPMRVAAVPDANHTFNYWDAPMDARADPYAAVIRPESNITVVPSYASRGGIGAIDTVADMTYFLGAINQQAAIHNVYTVDQFDCNEIHYDADINPVYCPNGMPDVAELYLVERVVKMGRTGLTSRSGVASGLTWQAWSTNLAQAQLDLPGQDPRVQRIVAGYMTLGDYENIRLVEHLVRVTFAVELTEAAYDREQQKFLKADEDADNDGLTNLEEWQTASPDGNLANLAAFAVAALDGHAPPAIGTNSAFAAEAMSILDFAAGACDCENFPCMAKGTVTPDAYPGPGEAYPILTDEPWGTDWNNQSEATPNGPDLPLGSEIQVTATPDTGKGFGFFEWNAPGTMLHGSRNKEDKFMLATTGETKPQALFGLSRTEIPDDKSARPRYVIEVTPSEGGCVRTEPSGRFVYGPPGSSVELTVKSTHIDRLYTFYGWCENPDSIARTYSRETTIRVPVGSEVYPLSAPVDEPAVNTVSVGLRASEGGRVLGCESYGHTASFLDKVVVAEHSGGLSLAAVPSAGYEFVCWTTAGLDPDDPYLVNLSVDQVQSAEAELQKVKQYELDLKVELSKDSEGGDAKCAGYVTADPARKYYQSGTIVTLVAERNPGYAFKKWKGEGVSAGGEDIESIQPIADDFFHAFILQIRMTDSRSVTAVYAKSKAVVLEGGGVDSNGSWANAALDSKGYETRILKTPSIEIANCHIPLYKVFVFEGHAEHGSNSAEDTITINHPAGVKMTPALVSAANAGNSYKLVFLDACDTAYSNNGENWKSAFNATCFVGWRGPIGNIEAMGFSEVFWENMGKGQSAQSAYADACKRTLGRVPEPGENGPVIIGDTTL